MTDKTRNYHIFKHSMRTSVASAITLILVLSIAFAGGVPDSLRNPPDSIPVDQDTLTALLDSVITEHDTLSVLPDSTELEPDSLVESPIPEEPEPVIPAHDINAVGYHAAEGGGVEARPCPPETVYDVPFGVGEQLRYYMEFSFVKAGMSEMSVTSMEMIEGRPVYHFKSRVKSTRGIDFIYKVRDYVEAWFDVGGLYSLRYERDINEGTYHSKKYYDYDHDTGWVAISNENGPKGITAFLPYSHNIISALFWVRAQDLVENTELVIPVHDMDVQYPLTIKVYEKETIKVPAGEFHCIKVEPVIESEGLFKKAGRVIVWITDDERRIPVRMSTKIPVGTIDGNLVEYRLGTPYQPGMELPEPAPEAEDWDW
jgi:Protein of unknown function (DUF3108)